ncbi:acetyl-CoA carboxylase, biotin carboxyl carrier protein [Ruminiclostridium papyrosolvens DSM 2782]|uniref:Biotin carboxyl carrier protein of acetyl-CoA carboxylase n=1 Tax=Ruminiclostridium papyrosolvens DSM 2782 TaxID=588581 RepID=F1T719_9FIRM|nr:acetyl-CoA carboxylase biotin carboxyl carrier protein [Ruminiclostridium papyrosolvens]EGD49267.1 acetyl-CoA carboxylase, biotin carboxyl carrier protein [Ruminiclostridium papyrosolvens DSM 2782]WES33603.1 acetyl-CoA carboxylase biotin carboxyl carrier protein [Ruminiclostridium papyrosolvens DSM 2782]
MNIEQIKELVKIVNSSNVNIIEINEGDSRIRIEMERQKIQSVSKNEVQLNTAIHSDEVNADSLSVNPSTKEIKAPMVGIFYTAPSSKDKEFVATGDKVKKGQVVCIIEAMKLFNEIVAEEDGEIVEICAQNGDVVEFGQPIFRYL